MYNPSDEIETARVAAVLVNDYGYKPETVERFLTEGDCIGPYDRAEDYVRELMDELAEGPEWLRRYIDHAALTRDMILGGELTVIEVGHQVYLLREG